MSDQSKIDGELWNEMAANEAAKEKAGDDAPFPDPKPSPEPPEAPPSDPWEAVPQDLRQQYENERTERAKLEQRIRSDDGRVAAYQRRIEELKKTVQQPTSTQPESVNDILGSAIKDYPEIAEPLTKALSQLEGRVNDQERAETGRREAAQSELQSIVQTETRRLDEAHPDWFDTLQKNGPAFAAWVEDQPRRIRDAAYRNADHVIDASEATEVISQFKQHLGLGPVPQPAPAPQPNDRRSRQLDASASPQRSTRLATISGIPEDGDPKAIWDAMEAQERQA